MDQPITLAVLGLLIASHAALWYKLGRMEARIDTWCQLRQRKD